MLSIKDFERSYENRVFSACMTNPAGLQYYRRIASYLRNGCINSGEHNVQYYTSQQFREDYGIIDINWVFSYDKLKRENICERISLEPFDDGSIIKRGDIEENNRKIGTIETKYDKDGNIQMEKVEDLNGIELYIEKLENDIKTSCLVHPIIPDIIVVTRDGKTKYVETGIQTRSIEERVISSKEVSKEEIEKRIPYNKSNIEPYDD